MTDQNRQPFERPVPINLFEGLALEVADDVYTSLRNTAFRLEVIGFDAEANYLFRLSDAVEFETRRGKAAPDLGPEVPKAVQDARRAARDAEDKRKAAEFERTVREPASRAAAARELDAALSADRAEPPEGYLWHRLWMSDAFELGVDTTVENGELGTRITSDLPSTREEGCITCRHLTTKCGEEPCKTCIDTIRSKGRYLEWEPRFEPLTKPPLGLRPAFIVREARLREIERAMQRYVDAGEDIPYQWVGEWFDLADEED